MDRALRTDSEAILDGLKLMLQQILRFDHRQRQDWTFRVQCERKHENKCGDELDGGRDSAGTKPTLFGVMCACGLRRVEAKGRRIWLRCVVHAIQRAAQVPVRKSAKAERAGLAGFAAPGMSCPEAGTG